MLRIEKTSLRDLAATQLRSAIESGSLAPDSPLAEASLAAELGVSRTPTREALLQLAEERYVISEPGRGFRVAPISLADGVQIESLMATLESVALAESPPKTPEEMDRLWKAHARFAKANGPTHQQELDETWHALLLGRCRNGWTLRYIEQLRGHLRRYNRIYIAVPGHHERSITEHEDLLHTLEAGDRALASEQLRTHWEGGIERAWQYTGSESP